MYTIMHNGKTLYDPRLPGFPVERPKLAREANVFDTLTFTLYPLHQEYGDLDRSSSILGLYQDSGLVAQFIPVYQRTVFNGGIEYKCKNILCCMEDFYYRPLEFSGTASGFIDSVLTAYNARVDNAYKITKGSIHPASVDYKTSEPKTCFSALKAITDANGGYLAPRFENGTIYLDYLQDADLPVCDQKIVFGDNMTDLFIEKDTDNCYSVLYPFGTNSDNEVVSIADANGGVDYLENASAVASYGRREKMMSWANVETPAELLSYAQTKLSEIAAQYYEAVSLSAVDLHHLDVNIPALSFLSMVDCVSAPHGYSHRYPATKMEIPLDEPKSESITLGTAPLSMTDRITLERQKNEAARSSYGRAISKADKDIESHWVHVTQVTDKGMSDSFGIIGVKIGADGMPMKDASGNYIWDDTGTGGEIWGHLNRNAWTTVIQNSIQDANGRILSIGQVLTSADGQALITAINDQHTGTAKIIANRLDMQATDWARWGVVTEDEFTAGGIVGKINEGTEKILGNKLDPGATDFAAWGVYTGDTLTGGIIVEKLNDSSTVTRILGSRVDVQATDLASWGVYTDDTLSAGILVDKINSGNTLYILGDKVVFGSPVDQYVAVGVQSTDNPKQLGYYERTAGTYTRTQDEEKVPGKTYYKKQQVNGKTLDTKIGEMDVTINGKLTVTQADIRYATIENLNTQRGRIDNLISGNTTATVLRAGDLYTTNDIYVGRYIKLDDGNGDIVKSFFNATLKFGSNIEEEYVANGSLKIGLQASVSGGQVTISFADNSGGNHNSAVFNIADTQFYRDGVSAARNSARIISANDNVVSGTLNMTSGQTMTIYPGYVINGTATKITDYALTINAPSGAAPSAVRVGAVNKTSGWGVDQALDEYNRQYIIWPQYQDNGEWVNGSPYVILTPPNNAGAARNSKVSAIDPTSGQNATMTLAYGTQYTISSQFVAADGTWQNGNSVVIQTRPDNAGAARAARVGAVNATRDWTVDQVLGMYDRQYIIWPQYTDASGAWQNSTTPYIIQTPPNNAGAARNSKVSAIDPTSGKNATMTLAYGTQYEISSQFVAADGTWQNGSNSVVIQTRADRYDAGRIDAAQMLDLTAYTIAPNQYKDAVEFDAPVYRAEHQGEQPTLSKTKISLSVNYPSTPTSSASLTVTSGNDVLARVDIGEWYREGRDSVSTPDIEWGNRTDLPYTDITAVSNGSRLTENISLNNSGYNVSDGDFAVYLQSLDDGDWVTRATKNLTLEAGTASGGKIPVSVYDGATPLARVNVTAPSGGVISSSAIDLANTGEIYTTDVNSTTYNGNTINYLGALSTKIHAYKNNTTMIVFRATCDGGTTYKYYGIKMNP